MASSEKLPTISTATANEIPKQERMVLAGRLSQPLRIILGVIESTRSSPNRSMKVFLYTPGGAGRMATAGERRAAPRTDPRAPIAAADRLIRKAPTATGKLKR